VEALPEAGRRHEQIRIGEELVLGLNDDLAESPTVSSAYDLGGRSRGSAKEAPKVPSKLLI
jgi:hypothetical protein